MAVASGVRVWGGVYTMSPPVTQSSSSLSMYSSDFALPSLLLQQQQATAGPGPSSLSRSESSLYLSPFSHLRPSLYL